MAGSGSRRSAYRLDDGEIAVLVRHGQAELRCEQCGRMLVYGLEGQGLYCPDCHVAYGRSCVVETVEQALTALVDTWQSLE